jgi:tRNA (guanine-N7-)-methyltransferase
MTSEIQNQAPSNVAFPKNIKSFVKRAGRTTTGQAKAFEVWGPQFLLNYAPEPLNMAKAFGIEGDAGLSKHL